MRDSQQKAAAKEFAEEWKGKGYEKGQSQPFWLELLNKVYGVANPTQFISFEDQVHIDSTSFIDGTNLRPLDPQIITYINKKNEQSKKCHIWRFFIFRFF